MVATPLTASGMAEAFIFETLSADSQVLAAVSGIYSTVAPEGAVYPFIVFAALGGIDTTAMGPYRTLSRFQYAVKAITNAGSILGLDAVMKRVDTLLMGASKQYSQGYVAECTRQRQMVLGDPAAGMQYRQLINTYEIVTVENP